MSNTNTVDLRNIPIKAFRIMQPYFDDHRSDERLRDLVLYDLAAKRENAVRSRMSEIGTWLSARYVADRDGIGRCREVIDRIVSALHSKPGEINQHWLLPVDRDESFAREWCNMVDFKKVHDEERAAFLDALRDTPLYAVFKAMPELQPTGKKLPRIRVGDKVHYSDKAGREAGKPSITKVSGVVSEVEFVTEKNQYLARIDWPVTSPDLASVVDTDKLVVVGKERRR